MFLLLLVAADAPGVRGLWAGYLAVSLLHLTRLNVQHGSNFLVARGGCVVKRCG
jgi:hypothetical protein